MIGLSEINKQRQENKLQKDLADALKRLYSNPDFVLVFKTYYSETHVLALVSQLALYDTQSLEHQELLKELNVISNFNMFLDRILTNGAMAEVALRELTAIPDDEIDSHE